VVGPSSTPFPRLKREKGKKKRGVAIVSVKRKRCTPSMPPEKKEKEKKGRSGTADPPKSKKTATPMNLLPT